MKSLKIYVLSFSIATPTISLCEPTRFENLITELAKNNIQTLDFTQQQKQLPSLRHTAACGVFFSAATCAILLISPEKRT